MDTKTNEETFPAVAGNPEAKHSTPAAGAVAGVPATESAPVAGLKWFHYSAGRVWEANLIKFDSQGGCRLVGVVRRLPNGNFVGIFLATRQSFEFFRRQDARRFVDLEYLKEGAK